MIGKEEGVVMFDILQNLIIKKREVLEGLTKEIEKAYKVLFTDFFVKHPSVELLRFKIYTPSFNDGDPCEPTLTSPEVKFFAEEEDKKAKDLSEEDEDYEEEDEEKDFYDDYALESCLIDHSSLRKDLECLEEMNEALEDILYRLYGTNVQIIVNRKKIEVEEYECGY